MPLPLPARAALRMRWAKAEPCLHMKKAVEADELARYVKADQIAHPAEQRNIGDAEVGAHHLVATREPFVENIEQPLVLIGPAGDFIE
jgi:hypothetical protein